MDPYTALKEKVDAHIQSLCLDTLQPSRLYRPMHYILALKGKRIRPMLTLLAYQAVGRQSPEPALDLAVAVELFHNFTLMHDDIMDRAPVRRGSPTVHEVWDSDVAILSGDALFAFSIGRVVRGFPERAEALAEVYSRVAMEVCEGQMEDMDLAAEDTVSIDRYLEMIRKKTAALLGGCMRLGALAAGGSEAVAQAFDDVGQYAGIAFQLQDDLMDAFPPDGFGKQVGGDIIENKKTYLWLKAMEHADEAQRSELWRLYHLKDETEAKVQGIRTLFETLKIPALTRELIDTYFNQAKAMAATLETSTDFEPVKAFLEIIAKRKI